MSATKDNLMDFDDSGYETLSKENKYKKIADFHVNQMKVIQDSIFGAPVPLTKEDIETLTYDKRREEADSRERDLVSEWLPSYEE